jgi:hypothetical protein
MQQAGAVLQASQPAWEEPAEAGTPDLSVLEAPALFRDAEAADLVVIPTPIRVRGRTILARFGPPLVFALAVAGIAWFWPPF